LEGRCKLVFRAEGLKLSEDYKHLKGAVQRLDQREATDKAAIQGRSKRRGQTERSDYAYLSSDQKEGQS
jgi:hypothetical protein